MPLCTIGLLVITILSGGYFFALLDGERLFGLSVPFRFVGLSSAPSICGIFSSTLYSKHLYEMGFFLSIFVVFS